MTQTSKDAEERVLREVRNLKHLLNKDAEGLSDGTPSAQADKQVSRSIHLTAGICAAVATQPLPFADIFILTPIQATLACKIARTRGHEVSRGQASRLLRELAGVIGLGLAGQQTAIGLYKLGLPGLGGFMTIPLVYGITYGIGRVIDLYYVAMAKGIAFDKKQAKRVFKSGRKEGKNAASR